MRLGFTALPTDKPKQRVFSVKLNGKTVLTNFDILNEVGAPDHAVWKEFVVDIESDLLVDFIANSSKPSPPQMPLISGMQVIRERR